MATASAVAVKLPSWPSLTRRHSQTNPISSSFLNPSEEERAHQFPFVKQLGLKPIKCISNSGKSGAPTKIIGNGYRFLQLGPHKRGSARTILAKSGGSSSNDGVTVASTISQNVLGIVHLVVSLGIVLAMDKLLKEAFVAAAIKFPSALFGMFCTFSILVILDATVPSAAKSLENFFEPAILFIQRWLPLFYVPSLVVLPLAVKDIPAASGAKILCILVGGWLASLCVAGFTAIAVRNIVKTEMIPAEPMSKPPPFSVSEAWAWTAVFLVSFISAFLYPTILGTSARTCLPFLLAATVLGYIVGSGLPSGLKKLFHPIICCALSADLAAFAFGYISKTGIDPVLGLQPTLLRVPDDYFGLVK